MINGWTPIGVTTEMDNARRHQYLEAMGIDVWALRRADAPATSVRPGPAVVTAANETVATQPEAWTIGPGRGQTLMLCAGPAEPATPVAADIARFVDPDPVWAWPSPRHDRGVTLNEAVCDRLFTRILDFAAAGNSAESKATLKGIDWVEAASLRELSRDAGARQSLWTSLAARGWYRGRRA